MSEKNEVSVGRVLKGTRLEREVLILLQPLCRVKPGPAMAGQIPDRAYILYLQIYLMLGYFNGRILPLHGRGVGSIPTLSTI